MSLSKIVIASDSYKGCLSSREVACAAADALGERFPGAEIVSVPVADGGEGTVETLVDVLHGCRVSAVVSDPLGRPVSAQYCICGDLAVIEVAAACGLTLVSRAERDPMLTTTRGVGELILDAVGRGCRRFLVGLGGTATNDGGRGMVQVPGFLERTRGCRFTVACDVTTTFDGATREFAPQKGARPQDIPVLEQRMRDYAAVIREATGVDVTSMPGAGAAGGLGGAFAAWLGAELKPGIDMILDAIGFDDILEGADLVITGEGHSDFQTPHGKTPWGVLERASRRGVRVVLMSGAIDYCPEFDRFWHCLPVTPAGQSLADAMKPEIAVANIRTAILSL